MGQVLCCCDKSYEIESNIVSHGDSSVTISLKTLKVVLLGDTRVGKSSFFKRFVRNGFEDSHKRTIGPDFVTKTLETMAIDEEATEIEVPIQVWDTAGHARYRDLCVPFYKETDIVIFMYDVTNRLSLENIEAWIHKFENNYTSNDDNNRRNRKNSVDSMDSDHSNMENEENDNNDNNNNDNNKFIGLIIGNKVDAIEGSISNNEELIISSLLQKYSWIKGHFMISCKDMTKNWSNEIIEKSVRSYVSTFIKPKESSSQSSHSLHKLHGISTPQTSAVGEQTPLMRQK